MSLFHTLPNKKIAFRNKTLDLSVPRVMGVLNVTPDSFSDGGHFVNMDNALRHCEEMIKYGVDIIDIGGESTRPNAKAVSTDEELSRVVPAVEAIRQNFGQGVWLSLDTSNPLVMQAGILAGADMINDVRALRCEGAVSMVASLDCPVVLMHARGKPSEMTRTMNDLAVYQDVVAEVIDELAGDVGRAIQAGITRDKLIIDVGMGFAKNYDHHKKLLKNLDVIIKHFDLPMLFGVSRKRFLGEILTQSQLGYLCNHAPNDRDNIGTAMHLMAIQMGVSIVRVHDVKLMAQVVRMWKQLLLP